MVAMEKLWCCQLLSHAIVSLLYIRVSDSFGGCMHHTVYIAGQFRVFCPVGLAMATIAGKLFNAS
jgi:hypothetical protein